MACCSFDLYVNKKMPGKMRKKCNKKIITEVKKNARENIS